MSPIHTLQKTLLGMLCATLLLGCASNPGKPTATLRYIAIVPSEEHGHDLLFTSDIDLTDLYDRMNSNIAQVSASLVCALGEDRDFDVNHNTKRVIRGGLVMNIGKLPEGHFLMKVPVAATQSQFGSSGRLPPSTVNALVANKAAIPCQAWVTAYFFKAYYSHTFYIPAADVMKTLGRPVPARD